MAGHVVHGGRRFYRPTVIDDELVAELEELAPLAPLREAERENFDTMVEALEKALADFKAVLDTQAERSEGLANCLRRTEEMAERLASWRNPDAKDLIRWVEVFSQSLALNGIAMNLSRVVGPALAGGLLALTIVYYAGFYTLLLKRRTPQNIVIGGAADRKSVV